MAAGYTGVLLVCLVVELAPAGHNALLEMFHSSFTMSNQDAHNLN